VRFRMIERCITTFRAARLQVTIGRGIGRRIIETAKAGTKWK
jgi:hypothetical protein